MMTERLWPPTPAPGRNRGPAGMNAHELDFVDGGCVGCVCGWISLNCLTQWQALRQFHSHASEMAETELTR